MLSSDIFKARTARFDWAALHGTHLAKADGSALERVIDALVEGDILLEPPLSPANYSQLIQLLQRAVQYAQHVGRCLEVGAGQLQACLTAAVELRGALQELCGRAEQELSLLSSASTRAAAACAVGQDASLLRLSTAAAERQAEQLGEAYFKASQALRVRPRGSSLFVLSTCLNS
jgi:hypothetical protein